MGVLLEEQKEQSIESWFLMSSPYPFLGILAMYLWFCLVAGPNLMKNRDPFQLKTTLIGYNLFQVILNTYIFITLLYGAVPYINYTCEPIADFNTSHGRFIIWSSYGIFLVKVIELFDTVLFVLRKKYNQVTALHVYHHVAVPLWGWSCVKYFPGGQTWLFVLLNIGVHSLMYSYYLIAALGPKYQKYLWWKKYMTILQLVQFMLAFLHGFQGLFRNCNFPKFATLLICSQSAIFFVLFGKFYIKSYMSPKKSETSLKNECIVNKQ